MFKGMMVKGKTQGRQQVFLTEMKDLQQPDSGKALG